MSEPTSAPSAWYQLDIPAGAPIDRANRFAPDVTREVVHAYGEQVHIHSPHSFVAGFAARISSDRTEQPELNNLLRTIYFALAMLAIHDFPRRTIAVRTPMAEKEGARGYWIGDVADPVSTPVVIADIARAGTVPAETLYGLLTTIISPRNVRKDLLVMSRKTDAEGKVLGTECGYSKIGGSIQDSILLIPEPMVATGGTIEMLFESYAALNLGKPLKAILLAMIITPEAIERLTKKFPDLVIHAARLDRNLSTPRALDLMPGLHKGESRGLNKIGYIVPGGGGLGERQTNAWV